MLALCALALLPALVSAQTEALDKLITSGTKAFQEQRYLVAERNFLTALADLDKMKLPDQTVADQRRSLILNGLGLVNIVRGKYEQGGQYLTQALEVIKKLYGPTHPDVAQCLINLGDLHYTTNDLDDALEYYQQAAKIIEALVAAGEASEAALVVPLSNISGVNFDRGQYDAAIPTLIRAIDIIKRIGGTDTDQIWCQKTLAEIYYKQDKIAEADTLLSDTLPLAEKAYGTQNNELLPILSRLADIRFATGKNNEAETLYKRVLARQVAQLAPDDPVIADTEHKLGVILTAKKNYTEAVTYLGNALTIRETILGEDAAETAATLHALGEIYNARKEYTFAQTVLERALRIRESKLGRNDRDTGATLALLALVEFNQDDVVNAEKHAVRALGIQEKALGKEHADLVPTLVVIGAACQAQDRFPDAEIQLRRALAIREKTAGADTPETLPILKRLADVLFKQNRPLEAVEYVRRMRLIEDKFGVMP